MIQSLFIGLALLGSLAGLLRTPTSTLDYDWKNPPLNFGAITFPSTLDVFENPGATQSVATVVTHSTQHGNANDALEAVEAKVGIGASTPLADTIFGGDGTGISGWFAWATSTRMTATNFLATSSSTLQSFTFVNATGTSATTTSIFATTASITNASSTNATTTSFFGADLSTCQSTNALTWSGGRFGCLAITTGGPTVFSTTTAGSLATTTFSISAGSLPNTDVWEITFVSASTTGSLANTADTIMMFNDDNSTNYNYIVTSNWGVPSAIAATSFFTLQSEDILAPQQYYKITVVNNPNTIKAMDWLSSRTSSTTDAFAEVQQGHGTWDTQSAITRIDIALNSPFAQFATGTLINILGY
jgi:hypothetical protein